MRILPTRTLVLAFPACLLLFPGPLTAQEGGEKMASLETTRKRVYENVEILFNDPHGITFRHSRGTAKIPFEQLSEAIRKKYKYDKEAALEFLRKHAIVKPAPPARAVVRKGPVYQFIPGAYTTFASGAPLTILGSTYADAINAARYVPPKFVYPVPVGSPCNLYLWRQLQLANHLTLSRKFAQHRVGGFGSVATRIHHNVRYPKVVHRSVPAIGYGSSVPAIGAGLLRDGRHHR